MIKIRVSAVVIALNFSGPLAAESFTGQAPQSSEMAQSFEAAMARIEARVVSFASSGGVVDHFVTPYDPMPLPDPEHLIEYNDAVATYWATKIDRNVDQFLFSYVALVEQMYARPWSLTWNASLLAPDDQILPARMSDIQPSKVVEGAIEERATNNSLGLSPEMENSPALLVADDAGLAADTGFFGDQ